MEAKKKRQAFCFRSSMKLSARKFRYRANRLAQWRIYSDWCIACLRFKTLATSTNSIRYVISQTSKCCGPEENGILCEIELNIFGMPKIRACPFSLSLWFFLYCTHCCRSIRSSICITLIFQHRNHLLCFCRYCRLFEHMSMCVFVWFNKDRHTVQWIIANFRSVFRAKMNRNQIN